MEYGRSIKETTNIATSPAPYPKLCIMSDNPGGPIQPVNHTLTQDLGKSIVLDAANADAEQHEQSVREAFWQNRKAVFWSMALSAALIMEGMSMNQTVFCSNSDLMILDADF